MRITKAWLEEQRKRAVLASQMTLPGDAARALLRLASKAFKEPADRRAVQIERLALRNGELAVRVRFLEGKLKKINCCECNGTELKHKETCPWKDK